jgi:drug/metabolite transporter (DMT)-like permease
MVEKPPKPPLSGIVYGEIAYWIVLTGMVISIIGIAMYLSTESNYIDSSCLLSGLWNGADSGTIWKECAGGYEEGNWYLKRLSSGDGVAMLGIALSCLAAVFGVWGSVISMLKSREYIFIVLAFIVAVILTASATGLISLKH